MIDFIRFNYRDNDRIEDFVCDNENFKELYTVLEYHTGEIKYPYNTSLGNLDVCVNSESVCVKNSIHKLHNLLQKNKSHNHNDFKFSELCSTIDYIDSKLIDLKRTRLTQLEFGLNIQLPVPAEKIIRQNIILQKFKLHSHSMTFDGRGEYKQFDHYNYYFKIYDKAKQYKLSDNIIRLEIKYKNSKDFNPLDIYNIHHLKDKGKLRLLFNNLLKRFDELTIVDDYSSDSSISKSDKKLLESYLSFNYWNELSERNKRNHKPIEIKKFQQLLVKNDLLKTKSLIRERLIKKFDELINS